MENKTNHDGLVGLRGVHEHVVLVVRLGRGWARWGHAASRQRRSRWSPV